MGYPIARLNEDCSLPTAFASENYVQVPTKGEAELLSFEKVVVELRCFIFGRGIAAVNDVEEPVPSLTQIDVGFLRFRDKLTEIPQACVDIGEAWWHRPVRQIEPKGDQHLLARARHACSNRMRLCGVGGNGFAITLANPAARPMSSNSRAVYASPCGVEPSI